MDIGKLVGEMILKIRLFETATETYFHIPDVIIKHIYRYYTLKIQIFLDSNHFALSF